LECPNRVKASQMALKHLTQRANRGGKQKSSGGNASMSCHILFAPAAIYILRYWRVFMCVCDYLVKICHERALAHNDRTPNENHHVMAAFKF
jgi:hypothetical protein